MVTVKALSAREFGMIFRYMEVNNPLNTTLMFIVVKDMLSKVTGIIGIISQ